MSFIHSIVFHVQSLLYIDVLFRDRPPPHTPIKYKLTLTAAQPSHPSRRNTASDACRPGRSASTEYTGQAATSTPGQGRG